MARIEEMGAHDARYRLDLSSDVRAEAKVLEASPQRKFLKTGRGLGAYVERALKGEARASDGAFVEEAAYEGYAVRDAVG